MITALVDIARCVEALTLVSGILAISARPVLAQTSTPIAVESYLIPSWDPGIQLYVRNKRPGNVTNFSNGSNCPVRARLNSGLGDNL